MATTKKKGSISKSTASKSYNQKTLAKMKARDADKSSSSSSSKSSTPDYTLRPGETVAQWNARTGGNASVVKPTGTPQQTVDRAKAMLEQTKVEGSAPFAGSTFEQNLNQPAPTQPEVPVQDWAQQFSDMWGQQNTDIKGTDTQSTQGAQTAVNESVAPMATGQQAPGGGVNADTSGGGGVTPGQPQEGAPTTAPTGATGGYVKVGPAYFQKAPDGLRAVSDPTVISGLKHGTIPYATQGLDGTTFSQYSVPLLNQGQAGATPPDPTTDQGASPLTTYNAYQSKYGLTQTQNDFFSDPMGTISGMVKSIFKMSGVDQANDVIKDISQELEDLENQRDDEIADVNDNPWLTEGVRLRQIESIEGRYEDKIANRTNKLKLLEDVRNNAQQQAQFAVGTAISLWDKQRTFQQWQIDNWVTQAQREFENDLALKEYNLQKDNSKYSTNAKDWLLAREYGYDGSFYDWLNPKDTSSTSGIGGVFGSYQFGQAQKNLTGIAQLKEIATRNPGIFGASASLPVPQFLRSDDFRNYSAILSTVKSNIAFGELQAMRNASKTGGALGAVSEKELVLLENALGALQMNQSPEMVMTQLNQIESSITNWMNAVYQAGIGDPVGYFGGQAGGEIVNSPDGPVLILPNSTSPTSSANTTSQYNR